MPDIIDTLPRILNGKNQNFINLPEMIYIRI